MRIWPTLAAVAGAAAVTGVALAATGHSAQGSGHVTFGATHENGNAEVNDATAGVRAHIDVNCLNVIGNYAIVSGVVTRSNDPTLVGDEAAFAVQDNGEGAKAPPDLMSIVNFYNVGVGPDCRVLSEYDLVPLEGGNIQVD